jgi:hypothetical protein
MELWGKPLTEFPQYQAATTPLINTSEPEWSSGSLRDDLEDGTVPP